MPLALIRLLQPLGRLLRPMRAGPEGLLLRHPQLASVPVKLRLSSNAFAADGKIPAAFCGERVDRSPPISWEGVPARTQSLVLIIEDADIPWPRPLLHALVYGLSPRLRGLPDGALSRHPPANAPALVFGFNSLAKRRYLAPAPLPGHGPHRYYFQLLAIDIPLSFSRPALRRDLLAKIEGHTLACGSLMGTAQR